MQEEIEQKSFNLMISTTKLSARTVLRAIKAALRLYQSKASQGKQSVRTLLRQNRGVSSVEISKTGIRGLERYAKKYGIDYAIRKDTSEVPPRYLVFFKAPDAEAFQSAFREYSASLLNKDTVKEVRPRYSCFYKIRHPGDCDGQSGYGVSKLDSIVEEVVRQIFAQFREVSRKKLLESVKTNDAARIQKKVKKIQKDLESKQKELDDLKAETILVIRGVSALDKELLGTLVAEAKDALETLEKQFVQAQEEYDEATKTAKRSNYICNELFTWADVYDTANHDERRAILQQFIKEIRVRKDYEISITLNASFNQVEQLKAVSTYDGAEIFEEISEKGA